MTGTIGMVGMGNAGAAMLRALSGKAPLLGHDLDPRRCAGAAALGVDVVDDVASLAARADAVILSLPRPQASKDVVARIAAARGRTQVIVETSTVTPATAVECHAVAAEAGIAFVDAAIAGGVASMAAGRITFFLGGAAADVAKARPVLDLLAERVFELGPIGAGMGAKVVNNAVMHALMVVLIEAFSMSTKLGVPVQTMIDILNREEGLMRPLVHRVQERIKHGDYAGGMSVTNARKDSVLAIETAQALGVPLFATLAAHTPYEIAEASGMGDLDYASLAKLWEAWSGTRLGDDG